jgi:hypothetical protein
VRDDLYRTVPTTSKWRRVLRYACREADWPQAQAAMEAAIRSDVLSKLDPRRLEKLIEGVKAGAPDLWNTSPVPARIDAYAAQAVTEHERRLGQMLHGILCRDGYQSDLVTRAVRDLCVLSVRSCIEHCCALLRSQGEGRQAPIVRRQLTELARDLTFQPVARNRKPAPGDLLDFSLNLRGI